jgi:Fe-S cluster biosynthesis and repair protein YggX
MSHYYLYLIQFEDGRFYIGSRKSKVPAEKDVNYWGSPGKTIKHLWEMKKEKHILFESTDISLQNLHEKEYKMIKEGWEKFGKDKCINKNANGLSYMDDEVRKNAGKKGGYLTKKNKTGIHGLTPQERKKFGKESYELNKQRNTGWFSLSEEEKFKASSKGAKKTVELQIGIHDVTRRKEYASLGGKVVGKNLFETGRGIWGMTDEQKSERMKRAIAGTKEKQSRNFSLISPDGVRVDGKNVREFSRKYNLDSSSVIKVLKGKQSHCKGWTRVLITE